MIGCAPKAQKKLTPSICDHVDLQWVSSQIPVPKDTRIIFKQKKGTLCEAVLSINGDIIPVYATQTQVLAGQMFKDGKSQTKASLNAIPGVIQAEKNRLSREKAIKKQQTKIYLKKNVHVLEELVSLSFTPDHASNSIYVITDPRCSHCKRLLNRLKDAGQESKTQIKVIIYPLLGSKSRKLAAHAVCSGYSFDQYLSIDKAVPVKTCQKADQLLKKTFNLFEDADLSSVPVVVSPDGSWVVDDNDINRIKMLLGLMPDIEADEAGETCGQETADQ